MSRLIDSIITINQALQSIKDGKYVMPAFQRQLVWEWNKFKNDVIQFVGVSYCYISILAR